MLELRKVSKVYGGAVPCAALQDIDLVVPAGLFASVMGPSGSGKTTLLNVISTIDRPTSGSVLIDGQDPHRLRPAELARFRREHLGFVFQDFNLLDTLTVRENILLPLVLSRTDIPVMKARLDDLAHLLGIGAILDKRTFEISGGQAQRTAIARAVIHRPRLLLADEPTGNLDSRNGREVMELLRTLNRELGTTILMVTHDPAAASVSDRVLFIKDGRLERRLEAGEVRREFLGAIMRVMEELESAGGQ